MPKWLHTYVWKFVFLVRDDGYPLSQCSDLGMPVFTLLSVMRVFVNRTEQNNFVTVYQLWPDLHVCKGVDIFTSSPLNVNWTFRGEGVRRINFWTFRTFLTKSKLSHFNKVANDTRDVITRYILVFSSAEYLSRKQTKPSIGKSRYTDVAILNKLERASLDL